MKYTYEQLEQLWEEFGDVPMYYSDEYPDGILENDWLVFEAGTERMEIWHWFDEHYSKGVYRLMFKND